MGTLSAKWMLIIVAIAAIVLALAADRFNTWLVHRRAMQATFEPIRAKVEATDAITTDAIKSGEDRAGTDAAIGTAREQFRSDIDRSNRDDPTTAARADRPVPDSVRDAFRKRRLARERSGGARGGDDARPPAPPAPER